MQRPFRDHGRQRPRRINPFTTRAAVLQLPPGGGRGAQEAEAEAAEGGGEAEEEGREEDEARGEVLREGDEEEGGARGRHLLPRPVSVTFFVDSHLCLTL